jgi:cellulose/xylan binding protein with CBM9 domain
MTKRFAMLVLFVSLIACQGMAQTENVPVESFEINDAAMTGGSVTFSMIDEVSVENVPEIDGAWALYTEYDCTNSNSWSQAGLTLPVATDLTGVTELRFSMYFLDSSTTDGNGNVPVRMHLPPDDCLSFDYIKPGEWYDVVLPIDPYRSANEMAAFNRINMVISAGTIGTGGFYLDNIYAVRPLDPPALEIVSVYGLNNTNPGDDSPLGWMKDQSELAPALGADYVTPSEGDNCMLIPVTQNGMRAVKTINTKDDVDWSRVRAIYFDACVTDDFSTWCVIRPYLVSTSGGTSVPVSFSGISNNKADWRTLSFSLDLGPHMNSIIEGGDFAIGFHHDNGGEANTADGQNILIDNIRFGLVSSFCLAVRSFDDNTTIYQGDSGSYGVELSLTMQGETDTVTVLETLPEGWSASDISNGGTVADGVITWDVEVSSEATVTLTYNAVSPGEIVASPVWSGTVDGESIFGSSAPLYFSQYVKDTLVEAPFLSNTVTLDGIISDAEYDGANVYTFDHDASDGNTAPGVHISGVEYPADVENISFYVFHDAEYLFVALDVTDPSLSFEYSDASFWNADSTEIYLDGNLSRSESIEGNYSGCQLTVVGDGRIASSNNKYFPEMLDAQGGGKYMEDGRDGENEPIYWAVGVKAKDDASGFVVEYRIIKDQILDPVSRTQIGFDIMMNSSDADNPGVRTGKWGWHSSEPNGNVFEPYNNESGWTLLDLLDGGTPVVDWSLF